MSGVLSALLGIVCAIVQPTSATCPRGWWLSMGVRTDGSFACELVDSQLSEWPSIDSPSSVRVWGRVYCTHARPLQRGDGRGVSC